MTAEMKSIFTNSGRLLKSLNLSLLPTPPPSEELTGNDICFLGPNGEYDSDKITLCADLPFGMRGIVGSWCVTC